MIAAHKLIYIIFVKATPTLFYQIKLYHLSRSQFIMANVYTIKISFDMLSKISAVSMQASARVSPRQTNDEQRNVLAHPLPLSPMQNKTRD